jgi:DNA polymerase I-like protein with 3'-5' exonuclease and polymerase domains
MILTFDAETTITNKGHVYTPANFLVCYSYRVDDQPINFKYYTEPDFRTVIREVVSKTTLFVGFNAKFDIQWLRRNGIELPSGCRVFDCQLADFILSGQTRAYESLDNCLERHSLPPKQDKVKEYWEFGTDTHNIPIDILQEYNDIDVQNTYLLYKKQLELLTPKQHKLVLLEGLDLLALAEAEWNGMKFDVEGAKREIQKYQEQLVSIEEKLSSYLPVGIPPQCGFNFDSGDQLSALLYGGEIIYEYPISSKEVYKSGLKKGEAYIRNRWMAESVKFPNRFRPLPNTEVKKTKDNPSASTRFYQVDDPTLKQLKTNRKENKELLKTLETRAKITKVKEMMESMLNIISKFDWQDNLIHGQFHQNVVRTGRLSSSQPNQQNQPPELDQLLVSRYD